MAHVDFAIKTNSVFPNYMYVKQAIVETSCTIYVRFEDNLNFINPVLTLWWKWKHSGFILI